MRLSLRGRIAGFPPPQGTRLTLRLRFLAPLLLLISTSRPANAQQPSTRIANYLIDATLDTASRSVDAREIVTWHNTSTESVSQLRFHLYPNAYKSVNTTFMYEAGTTLRPGASGWIDIQRVVDERTGEDITDRINYIRPDDGNMHDSTVMVLSLLKSVPPRDSISVSVDFHERLQEAFTGSGWAPGTQFYMVARWFPKIGVFQNKTWNCHQFHALAGFFADFGTYDVRLTVPARFKVGATGEISGEPVDSTGTITYHFLAHHVHDFAWTASSSFLSMTRTFRHDGLPQTKMILLLQPAHFSLAERYFAALDTAMKYFGLWYGPYPYPAITIVDPPPGARFGDQSSKPDGVAGGVYPNLIIAGTHDFTLKDFFSPENAIVRGFGHQYWYGMIACNGFEEPWLDGGLDSYSAGEVIEKAYGPITSEYRVAGILPVYMYPILTVFDIPIAAIIGKVQIPEPYDQLPFYLENARKDPISRIGFDALDRSSYRNITDSKPELALRTLEGILGRDTMKKVLRTYFEKYEFKHPSAADFENVCQQVSGEDLGWFFSQLIDGTGMVDFAVRSVDFYRETDLSDGMSTYVTKVVVARNGDVRMPVGLRLSLDDGSAVDTVWDGQATWQSFVFRTAAKPAYAVLDPSGKIPLDADFANNSLLVHPALLPLLKWIGRIFNYFQNMLLNVGVLA